MRHQRGRGWPARRPGVPRRRFGRRSALVARTVPHVLRRPATVAPLRSIESRTTHSERIGGPRINVAVNLVHGAPTRAAHRFVAPLLRMPPPGQQTGAQRPDLPIWRRPDDPHGPRRPFTHPRSSLVLRAAPVERSASTAGTQRTGGGRRGLIDAPVARTISLAVTARQVSSRRLAVDDIGPTHGDRRSTDTDAARASTPPLDLERLTDKVVAAIDRRLWSHRERMGGR